MPDLYEGENDNTRVPAHDGEPPRPATEPPGAKPSSQTDKIDAGSGQQPPEDADASRQPS
jgi:hypothetical protein